VEDTQIYLDKKSIVHINFGGHLTYAKVKQILQKVEGFAERLDKPVLILCDMAGLKSDSVGSRVATAEAARSLAWQKAAFVGSSTFLRITISWIIKGAGVGSRARCFDSVKEAEEWLTS